MRLRRLLQIHPEGAHPQKTGSSAGAIERARQLHAARLCGAEEEGEEDEDEDEDVDEAMDEGEDDDDA